MADVAAASGGAGWEGARLWVWGFQPRLGGGSPPPCSRPRCSLPLCQAVIYGPFPAAPPASSPPPRKIIIREQRRKSDLAPRAAPGPAAGPRVCSAVGVRLATAFDLRRNSSFPRCSAGSGAQRAPGSRRFRAAPTPAKAPAPHGRPRKVPGSGSEPGPARGWAAAAPGSPTALGWRRWGNPAEMHGGRAGSAAALTGSRGPAPVRSRGPGPERSWVPAPVRSRGPAPERSWVPAPVQSWVPAPERSWVPAPPALTRLPASQLAAPWAVGQLCPFPNPRGCFPGGQAATTPSACLSVPPRPRRAPVGTRTPLRGWGGGAWPRMGRMEGF